MTDAIDAQQALEAQFQEIQDAIEPTGHVANTVTVAKKTPLYPQDAQFGGRPTG